MKPTKVLTPIQKHFLDLFSESPLTKDFIFTGGTALTGFYLPYRLSDDLDFFSDSEVDVFGITVFLKSIKDKLDYISLDTNTSFNRNLFFLKFPNFVLKTEFTYFPFPGVEKPNLYQQIKVDTPLDIAVNKLFTIYQKPRGRDFTDLYLLHKKKGHTVDELLRKAEIKFDWHIDPIKLGSQFLLATELPDRPKLLIKLKDEDWQSFFLAEAKKLGNKIFS